MSEKISANLVSKLRERLGPRGREVFLAYQEEYGTVSPVYENRGIPHPVHFREGMVVRNMLRDLTNNEWTNEEYDNLWKDAVVQAISL